METSLLGVIVALATCSMPLVFPVSFWRFEQCLHFHRLQEEERQRCL